MNIQADVESQETATAVGGEQSPVAALHSTHPGWISDGLGIRGPQKSTSIERATPEAMPFGQDSGSRNSSSPQSGRTSISITDGTTTVDDVVLINFDSDLFEVSDAGDGQVDVTLQTTDCDS